MSGLSCTGEVVWNSLPIGSIALASAGAKTIISTASTLCLVWLNKFETNRNDRNFGFNIINKRQGVRSAVTLPVLKQKLTATMKEMVLLLELNYMVTNRKKHASVTVSMSPMIL